MILLIRTVKGRKSANLCYDEKTQEYIVVFYQDSIYLFDSDYHCKTESLAQQAINNYIES